MQPARTTSLVLAMVAALALSLSPAAALDPGFTTFEEPDTSMVLADCRNDEVRAREAEIRAAMERLATRVARMNARQDEIRASLSRTPDPAQRQALIDEYLALDHWRAAWYLYRQRLELHVDYYASLPACGKRKGRRNVKAWPGDPAKPVSVGPFTPTAVDPKCSDPPYSEAERLRDELSRLEGQAARYRQELDAKARVLGELEAGGKGDGDAASLLRRQIDDQLRQLVITESAIGSVNKQYGKARAACPTPPPPPASPPPSTMPTPPPADNRHGSLPVPMGKCEAGMLAAVNAARADPSGYGQSLRGARGRFAEEARAFLADRAPAPALTADPRLMAAARAHGEDLAATNQVGHRGSDGRGLMDRFRAQGLYVTLSAEVIAIRQPTPAGALRALVIDEGHPGGPHRKDLFNPLFTMTGIACVKIRGHGQVVVIDLSNAPMS